MKLDELFEQVTAVMKELGEKAKPKARGPMATHAYKHFKNPVVVRKQRMMPI